jgi:hypothetical protein
MEPLAVVDVVTSDLENKVQSQCTFHLHAFLDYLTPSVHKPLSMKYHLSTMLLFLLQAFDCPAL